MANTNSKNGILGLNASNGQWQKKIAGVVRRFGAVSVDPKGEKAEALYFREKDAWERGENPRTVEAVVTPGVMLLREIVDRWLVMRRGLLTAEDKSERIAPNTYKGSMVAADLLMELKGKTSNPMTWTPEDWRELRMKLGAGEVSPATKGQRIMYIRAMFDWAARCGHIPHAPRYAGEDGRDQFAPVKNAEKEKYRYLFQKEHGERIFDLPDARRIIRGWKDATNARPHKMTGSRVELAESVSARLMYACTLIAANTGASSKDIASILFEDVDLDAGYVERLRAKTEILWQATLWPRTVEAIKSYIEVRPKPIREEWAKVVFITSDGYPVNHGGVTIKDDGTPMNDNRTDTLRQNTSKLLIALGIKAEGVTFGAWRPTFRTLASGALGMQMEDAKKVDAINRIMAHKMGVVGRYVKLKQEQLQPYTDAVHAALWPGEPIRESVPHNLRLVG